MINQAKWIWKNDTSINDYVILEKTFDIVDDIDSATIQVSAHNHFKLSVNGYSVGGYVSPAPTVANMEKYFLEYNITHLLRKGNNKIAITALYLGGDGQNYVNAAPGVIAAVEILHLGSSTLITTDESWESLDSIPYVCRMPFQQNRRISPSEYYDSRVNLSKSSRNKAVLSEMNSIAPLLVRQGIEEGVIHEEIRPNVIGKKNNVYLFDSGRIISGFVRFTLPGMANSIITIRYSEAIENGAVKHTVANEPSDQYFDRYIMNDEISQTHQADFTYKAFRYFEISGYPGVIDESDILVIQAGTSIDYQGYLQSDSIPWINQLNVSAKNTQLNNILGQVVDCPHREQAQYLGDTYLQSFVLLQNSGNATAVIKKTLRDFSNMMHEDGTMPFVSPTNETNPDFMYRIPEYNLYYIFLIYRLWKMSMNPELVREYYGYAVSIMTYFMNKIDDTGLVAKKESWHIDDWPYPTTDHSGNYLTYENMMVFVALKYLEEVSEALTEDFIFSDKIEPLYGNIRSKLMKDKLFVDSYGSMKMHSGINAFALNHGLSRLDELGKTLQHIKSNSQESSIILRLQTLQALFENNEVEAAISSIISPTRSWLAMLNKDLTLWEGFDDIESHSHAWTAYPLALLQKYLLGVDIEKSDKDAFVIRPRFIKGMTDLKGKVFTRFGWLTLKYQMNNDNLEIVYSIPQGCHVELANAGKITELKGKGKHSESIQGAAL